MTLEKLVGRIGFSSERFGSFYLHFALCLYAEKLGDCENLSSGPTGLLFSLEEFLQFPKSTDVSIP